jgi:hypothetical protein
VFRAEEVQEMSVFSNGLALKVTQMISPDTTLPEQEYRVALPRKRPEKPSDGPETHENQSPTGDIDTLLSELEACESRSEVEVIIGKASIAMPGHLFRFPDPQSREMITPTRAEIFELSWCTIFALFLSDQRVIFAGTEKRI